MVKRRLLDGVLLGIELHEFIAFLGFRAVARVDAYRAIARLCSETVSYPKSSRRENRGKITELTPVDTALKAVDRRVNELLSQML